jgi:ribosomal protein S12 methylthiotransferase accessory factor
VALTIKGEQFMDDIEVFFPGGKRVDAKSGPSHIRTDQPVELGGTGSAIAPYDLFLASLASCAGIYVLGFCQARGIPTDGLALVQHHEVDPESKLVRRVWIELRLPAGFPERYRSAVQRAAEGCKIKKTLANPPSFEVVLRDAPASSAMLASHVGGA